MRGVVGVWHLDHRPAEEAARRMMEGAGALSDGSDRLWQQEGVALGTVPFDPGRGAASVRGIARDDRYVLVADARIDNREEVARALPGSEPEGGEEDARLLRAAYARWGSACVDRLVGVFAFVVWDVQERVLFCARDPVGVRPLYYTFQPHRLFACASSLGALLALQDVPRQINEVRVADYLARRGEDTAATFYEGVLRLPPGHTLTLGTGRDPVVRRYWEFGGRDALHRASDAEFEEGFRAVFSEAVRCRLPQGPVGVLLSGGLDSSSVAGVAAGLYPGTVHSFSATFPDLPEAELRISDERAYVAAVAKAAGLASQLVPVSGHSPADELGRYLDHLHQPPFVSNLYLLHHLQMAARAAGVGVLLDGCEGDDAVSHGLERFWELGYLGEWTTFRTEGDALAAHTGGTSADVFAWLGRRGAMARARSRPVRFLVEAPALAALSGESVADVIVAHLLKPLLRPLVHRWRGHSHTVPALLSPDLVRRTDYEDRLEAYADLGRSTIMSAQELHRLVLTAGAGAIATGLEESSHLASMDGVERRHPFYDVRVLNYCLSLPVEQKLRDGWTRSILRRSLRDVLPESVRTRVDKADLSPHFYRSLLHVERERLGRLLRDDWERLEPFVDREVLRTAYDRHDGATLWSVLVLAEWLRRTRHAPEARTPRARMYP